MPPNPLKMKMSIEERKQSMLENQRQRLKEIENEIDFDLCSEEEGRQMEQSIKDCISLIEILQKHSISWEHLMRHAHTLTPKNPTGSSIYDLKDAN